MRGRYETVPLGGRGDHFLRHRLKLGVKRPKETSAAHLHHWEAFAFLMDCNMPPTAAASVAASAFVFSSPGTSSAGSMRR
jgi:hypothetical protein